MSTTVMLPDPPHIPLRHKNPRDEDIAAAIPGGATAAPHPYTPEDLWRLIFDSSLWHKYLPLLAGTIIHFACGLPKFASESLCRVLLLDPRSKATGYFGVGHDMSPVPALPEWVDCFAEDSKEFGFYQMNPLAFLSRLETGKYHFIIGDIYANMSDEYARHMAEELSRVCAEGSTVFGGPARIMNGLFAVPRTDDLKWRTVITLNSEDGCEFIVHQLHRVPA